MVKYQPYIGSSEIGLRYLKQGLGFKPNGWKQMLLRLERGDPTKGGQSDSLIKISHRQNH